MCQVVLESLFDELCGLRQIAVSCAVDWFCFVCRGYIVRNGSERWVGSGLEGNGCNLLGWVHTCNVTAYRNTVSWQCGRDSWPRNVSEVSYAVTLRACSVCCRYLAVASKGWYGYGRSRCGRATSCCDYGFLPQHCCLLLGAFANCGKRLLGSSCLVFPQETTRLHLEGFSWNFIFENVFKICQEFWSLINPLKPELNPICYLLALLGAHHFLHVSRIRVKLLTFRLLMSYVYGAPILDVSRSHTTTQHRR